MSWKKIKYTSVLKLFIKEVQPIRAVEDGGFK
jgi:hypothetical protein